MPQVTDNATFTTSAHGKWLLAGEHAVLRGSDALVFPLPQVQITLSYTPSSNPIDAKFSGPYAEPMLLVFWGLLETGLQHLGRTREKLTGQFSIENTIPVGMGLGFSAALCVVVSRWFANQGWLADDQQTLFHFAKQLEDHCHGLSSGVDVVGCLCEQPQCFTPPDSLQPLAMAWQPHLYLSNAGPISVTAQCIQAVATLAERDAGWAARIDGQMRHAVAKAQAALADSSPEAPAQLAAALNQARDCFSEWGLMPAEATERAQQLIDLGALAVKPTGAGGGGYLLSMWSSQPNQTVCDALQSIDFRACC